MPAAPSTLHDPELSPFASKDPVTRHLHAKLAAHGRHGNHEEAEAVRRELEWHQLETHALRVANEFEPMTDAQRDLAAWAAAHAAKAPRISPADAAPLVAAFRGTAPEVVNARGAR
jgi:hypothetical protein